jgi:hypothetical protein
MRIQKAFHPWIHTNTEQQNGLAVELGHRHLPQLGTDNTQGFTLKTGQKWRFLTGHTI